MTKPTKWHPATPQISLGIRPVWSESSLCAQWVGKDSSFLHADSEDSDQTGRMSRLIWVFDGHTWFCHEAAHYCNDRRYSDRQVWANSVHPGSTLFAVQSASYGSIRIWLNHTVQILQQFFPGVLTFKIITVMFMNSANTSFFFFSPHFLLNFVGRGGGGGGGSRNISLPFMDFSDENF